MTTLNLPPLSNDTVETIDDYDPVKVGKGNDRYK